MFKGTYVSSFTALIPTDQHNISINSGAHSSLHSICHHHTVHSRFNLNVYYPLPYQRITRDCRKENSRQIRKALDTVKWEGRFDKNNLNT